MNPNDPAKYNSPATRLKVFIYLMIPTLILNVIAAGISIYFANLVRGSTADTLNSSAFILSVTIGGFIGIISTGTGIGAVVAYCMWWHGTFRNLHFIKNEKSIIKTTPTWAVLDVLIPLWSAIKPYFNFIELINFAKSKIDKNTKTLMFVMLGNQVLMVVAVIVNIIIGIVFSGDAVLKPENVSAGTLPIIISEIFSRCFPIIGSILLIIIMVKITRAMDSIYESGGLSADLEKEKLDVEIVK